MTKYSLCFLLVVLFFIGSCENRPEQPDPQRRKSPIAITSINHNDTYLKITYGQPYKQGRQIFGDLVPYDEVWRTGANEATEITVTNDILFAGEKVEAGTYALFTIPGEEEWTIILNSVLGQWGAFDYDEDHDVLRVDVKSYTNDTATEAFTIRFGDVVDDSTSIIMQWDQTEVRIPVIFAASST